MIVLERPRKRSPPRVGASPLLSLPAEPVPLFSSQRGQARSIPETARATHGKVPPLERLEPFAPMARPMRTGCCSRKAKALSRPLFLARPSAHCNGHKPGDPGTEDRKANPQSHSDKPIRVSGVPGRSKHCTARSFPLSGNILSLKEVRPRKVRRWGWTSNAPVVIGSRCTWVAFFC
jgi:hypothetical protein